MNKLIQIINEEINKIFKVDINKLNEISKIIRSKYPHINSGGCGVFAKAFHNITGLPYMLIIDTGLLDEDLPIHVMIKLPPPDGRLYDGEGIKTKSTVREEHRYDVEGGIMFLEDVDGSIFDNYYEDLGSGLFTHCHKSEYDEIYNLIKTVLES
jgi:hypothetical protein